MTRLLIVLFALGACTSDSGRARAIAEWRASRDSVLSSTVVEALATPAAPGRIIYERPVDLSYDSLLVRRPDLVNTTDRPRR